MYFIDAQNSINLCVLGGALMLQIKNVVKETFEDEHFEIVSLLSDFLCMNSF